MIKDIVNVLVKAGQATNQEKAKLEDDLAKSADATFLGHNGFKFDAAVTSDLALKVQSKQEELSKLSDLIGKFQYGSVVIVPDRLVSATENLIRSLERGGVPDYKLQELSELLGTIKNCLSQIDNSK